LRLVKHRSLDFNSGVGSGISRCKIDEFDTVKRLFYV